MPNHDNGEILEVTRADQYRTVKELFAHSRPNSTYYTFLTLSVVIVAGGLLLGNGFIVVGGMLVAPVLTPALLAALGLAVGNLQPVKDAGVLMLKSSGIIIISSALIALVFGQNGETTVFDNTVRTAILYFCVAVASGAAATLAWTRKELSELVTGTAIALSLVPPLALVGIRLVAFNLEPARYYFTVFVFNVVGVVVGSLVVFSLLKFYKSEQKVTSEADEHHNLVAATKEHDE